MATAIVETSAGQLRGELRDDGSAVFRGVPFAAPPVGDNRFAPPQPVEPWTGVADALEWGPASVQAGGRLKGREEAPQRGMFGGMFGAGDLEVREDCLYLNVWTPGLDDRKRPVMVWIHGGAFRMGTGALPGYDGQALSTDGDVVVVTINYRLGLLGFLYAPELGAANLGLLDQVAALEWVRNEIAAFGGDPDQVTIFGESAGVKSVECLLAMPAASGLFSRAVVQSTYAIAMDTETAAQKTKALLTALGTDDVERLRTIPLLELLDADAASTPAAGGLAGGGGPVVDGDTLPVAPVNAFADGHAADVDVIVGTTLDEARLFGAFMGGLDEIDDDAARQRLAMFLPGDDDALRTRALEVYRKARADFGESTTAADVVLAVQTDRMFAQHSIRVAEALARHNPRTFMYLFAWKGTGMDGKLGACHGIEIPFVFGNLTEGMGRIAGDSPQARALSDVVRDAWLTFAKTGVPSPTWPAYDASTRSTIVFGPETRVVDAPLDDIRRFWTDEVAL